MSSLDVRDIWKAYVAVDLFATNQRLCPKPIPRMPAFLRRARSVRLIFFAISATGVRDFECALRSRSSSFVQGVP